MKNKDKRIKELEDKGISMAIIAFTGWALFILSLGLSIHNYETYGYPIDLAKQLQSCKEKIPTWTLKVHCENFEESIDTDITMKFDSYENYQSVLNKVIEGNECSIK